MYQSGIFFWHLFEIMGTRVVTIWICSHFHNSSAYYYILHGVNLGIYFCLQWTKYIILGIALILNNMPPILKSNFLYEYRYRKLLQVNITANMFEFASCFDIDEL